MKTDSWLKISVFIQAVIWNSLMFGSQPRLNRLSPRHPPHENMAELEYQSVTDLRPAEAWMSAQAFDSTGGVHRDFLLEQLESYLPQMIDQYFAETEY